MLDLLRHTRHASWQGRDGRGGLAGQAVAAALGFVLFERRAARAATPWNHSCPRPTTGRAVRRTDKLPACQVTPPRKLAACGYSEQFVGQPFQADSAPRQPLSG